MKRLLVSSLAACLILTTCGGETTRDRVEEARLVEQTVRATVDATATRDSTSKGQRETQPGTLPREASLALAVEASFQTWVATASVPYQDVEYATVSNDGTFATVRITAFLRGDARSGWREQESFVECRKVGGSWLCDPLRYWSLSQVEQARLLEQQNATATAVSQDKDATATADTQAGATATAVALDEQIAPLYDQALQAYESEDWWLAGAYLRQVAAIQSSYKQVATMLEAIDAEHPQGHILIVEAGDSIVISDAWRYERNQIDVGGAAVLSPSGQKVAFIRGNNLRLGPTYGEHPVVLEMELVADKYSNRFLSWSPDENSLLVPMDIPSKYEVVGDRGIGRFDIESGNVKAIIPPGSNASNTIYWATWAPGGERIAFHGETVWSDSPTLMDLTTGAAVELNVTESTAFAWSPDGEKIAFGRGRGIYTSQTDGSNAKPVVDADGELIVYGHSFHYVTWSPDGDKLLGTSYTGTHSMRLLMIDPNRSYAVDLGRISTIHYPPSWSR